MFVPFLPVMLFVGRVLTSTTSLLDVAGSEFLTVSFNDLAFSFNALAFLRRSIYLVLVSSSASLSLYTLLNQRYH